MSRLQGLVRGVHGWAGAIFALYLLAISLSGTLLLWKQAYLWLAIPEARVDFEPSPEALAAIAADVETRFGNQDILQVQFPLEPIRRTQEYSDAMLVGLDNVSGAGTGEWLPAMQRAQASFPDGTIRTASGLGLALASIFGLLGFLRRFRKGS